MFRMGLEPTLSMFEWYKPAGHCMHNQNVMPKTNFLYRCEVLSYNLMDYVNLITLPIRIEENVYIILFSRPFLESDTRMLMVMVHCLHQNLALRRLWTACKHKSTSHETMDICVNFAFRNFCPNNFYFETRLQSGFLF
jgi:hypothetical protein